MLVLYMLVAIEPVKELLEFAMLNFKIVAFLCNLLGYLKLT